MQVQQAGRSDVSEASTSTAVVDVVNMGKLVQERATPELGPIFETNTPIEVCPSCLVKLTPTQFTINIVLTVMKTKCPCGLITEINPKLPLPEKG